jgi:hypothetical protein
MALETSRTRILALGVITCAIAASALAAIALGNPGPEVDAQPEPAAGDRMPAQARAAYTKFLQAVKAEEAQSIRSAMWTPEPGQPRAVLDLVVEQLVTFRRFERLAGEKLGERSGDFGFGLTNAALDARMKAAREAELSDDLFLTLDPQVVGRDRVFVGLTSDIPMNVQDGTLRIDLPAALGSEWRRMDGKMSGTRSPPGQKAVAAFKRAIAELELGRIGARPALEKWLNDELKRVDDDEYAFLNDKDHAPAAADVAAAAQAVRALYESLRNLDAKGMRRSYSPPPDTAAAMLDQRIDEQLTNIQLGDALRTMRGEPTFFKWPVFDRTFGRLHTGRLVRVGNLPPVLLVEATDRLAALADPDGHAGVAGPPPERFHVVKTADGWKMDSSMVLPGSAEDLSKTRLSNGEDEAHKLRKELLGKVRAGQVRTEDELLGELEEINRQVATIVERRRLEEEDRDVADYQRWAASEKGKRAIETLTATNGRIQFRLVLGPNEKGDAEELPSPEDPGTKLRLAKQVVLNHAAIARAYPTAGEGGAVVAGVELTEEGARQMNHVTRSSIGRRLAIVLDGKILMAPTIRGPIKRHLTMDGGTQGYSPEELDLVIRALESGKRP